MTGRLLTPYSTTLTVYGAFFTIDRFADNKNAKLKKFNSKFWGPDTSQVDAFTIGWENDNNYLVPPTYLVLKVIKYLQSFKGQGTLVVPF